MTLEQLEKERPEKMTVMMAAKIMKVTPRFIQLGLQQGQFPFGVAVQMTRWSYYINTDKFIEYMKGEA